MSDYPTLPFSRTRSRQVDRDGRLLDYDGNGVGRVRKTAPDRADFQLLHPWLTPDENTALLTYYDTHSTIASFNFLWGVDGLTYVVRFGGAPRLMATRKDLQGNWRHTYEVKLLAA